MKTFFCIFLLLISCNAHAEIETKDQADDFLDQYCINLVNALEKAAKKQKTLAGNTKSSNFYKQADNLITISELYKNLCKE